MRKLISTQLSQSPGKLVFLVLVFLDFVEIGFLGFLC